MVIGIDGEAELEAHGNDIVVGIDGAFPDSIVGQVAGRAVDLKIPQFELIIVGEDGAIIDDDLMIVEARNCGECVVGLEHELEWSRVS